jgi:hypothetical protein
MGPMGWRKLTIPNGDLARCSELSATEQARRTPTLGIIYCGSISDSDSQTRSGWFDRSVRLAGPGDRDVHCVVQ